MFGVTPEHSRVVLQSPRAVFEVTPELGQVFGVTPEQVFGVTPEQVVWSHSGAEVFGVIRSNCLESGVGVGVWSHSGAGVWSHSGARVGVWSHSGVVVWNHSGAE